MDFFDAQAKARQRTSLLVALYALAVSGIIAAVYLVFVVVLSFDSEPGTPQTLWIPEVFLWVAAGVTGLVLCGSFFKTMQLSQGGAVVARSLGGRPVAPDTHDASERRLLNVVEEMALAAGTSVPQVFLLDDERGINAFAAGFSPRDAVIGVTRGCIEQLSRDELQGVIAHEFSHIVNGDMRLNIRLMGVLFGILMLTLVGQVLLRTAYFSGGGRSRGGKKQGGNPLPFIGLALIVIGYIGVFFANLIKSAISRQREFLSDASAVQYTRNPAGITGALKKIGGLSEGARVQNVHAAEASHLFFGEALSQGFIGLFATHPPLTVRIKRLDPAFNPAIARLMNPDGGARSTATGTAAVTGFAQHGAGSVNISAAAALIRQVPDALLDEVHSPVGARALVYALLWSGTPDVQVKQEKALRLDPQAQSALDPMRHRLAAAPPESRLPLAELAVPALRTMSADQYNRFRKTVKALTEADSEIDLFEFTLTQMMLRHIEPAFGRASTAPVRYRSVERILPACATVLSALAVWGTQTTVAAQDCYTSGMRKLSAAAPPLDMRKASLEDVAHALKTLAEAAPAVKRKVLDACAACILADGNIALAQRELFRAIADAMDVPMPPLNAA